MKFSELPIFQTRAVSQKERDALQQQTVREDIYLAGYSKLSGLACDFVVSAAYAMGCLRTSGPPISLSSCMQS